MFSNCACRPCRWDSRSPAICVTITCGEANTCSHEVSLPLSQRAEKHGTPYPPDTAGRPPRATGTRMTKSAKRCLMGLTAQASERIIQWRCEGKSCARVAERESGRRDPQHTDRKFSTVRFTVISRANLVASTLLRMSAWPPRRNLS